MNTEINEFVKAIQVTDNLNAIPAILATKELWVDKKYAKGPIPNVCFETDRALPAMNRSELEELWDDLKVTYGGDNDTINTIYIKTFEDIGINFTKYRKLLYLLRTYNKAAGDFVGVLIPKKICDIVKLVTGMKTDGSFVTDISNRYPTKFNGFTVFNEKLFIDTVTHRCSDKYAKDDDKINSFIDGKELLNALIDNEIVIRINDNYMAFKSVYDIEHKFNNIIQNASTIVPFTINFNMPFTPSPSQEEAIRSIVSSDSLMVGLSGEAGSGKTTVAKTIASNYEGNLLYLAPTGKAALVLQSNGCTPAKTISNAVRSVVQQKLGCVIVDECSMINTQFLDQLSTIIENNSISKVIMMGDTFQCQPVGAGSIFSSLMRMYPERFFKLSEQHRCADPIYMNRLHVLRSKIFMKKGDFGYTDYYVDGTDKKFAVHSNMRSIFQRISDTHERYLCSKSATMLCHENRMALLYSFIAAYDYYPTHIKAMIDSAVGDLDIGNSNKNVKKSLLEKCSKKITSADGLALQIKKAGYYFINGHKVMLLRNVYRTKENSREPSHGILNTTDIENTFLANGSVFTVTSVDHDNSIAILDNKYIVRTTEHAFAPATCITVHKSQGSTYEDVMFIQVSHNTPADVVYTALSRTRNFAEIVVLGTFDKEVTAQCKRINRRMCSLDIKK